MENASKALIIAATVLVSVLILAILVYLFVNYSEIASQHEENQAKQALVQYNTKFTKYEDKTLTIQDVYTIVNLAHDYNKRKSDNEISVKLGNKNLLNSKEAWLDQLEENTDDKYKINTITYYDDNTIKEITIKNEK